MQAACCIRLIFFAALALRLPTTGFVLSHVETF
jgi:hypothetical protein